MMIRLVLPRCSLRVRESVLSWEPRDGASRATTIVSDVRDLNIGTASITHGVLPQMVCHTLVMEVNSPILMVRAVVPSSATRHQMARNILLFRLKTVLTIRILMTWFLHWSLWMYLRLCQRSETENLQLMAYMLSRICGQRLEIMILMMRWLTWSMRKSLMGVERLSKRHSIWLPIRIM